MYMMYTIYGVERQLSFAEQQETDRRAAELAAAIADIGRAVKAGITRGIGGSRPRAPIIPGDDLIPTEGARR